MAETLPEHTSDTIRCPYLSNPRAGCFVRNITSRTIPEILEFCGERFKDCPLYRTIQMEAGAGEKHQP